MKPSTSYLSRLLAYLGILFACVLSAGAAAAETRAKLPGSVNLKFLEDTPRANAPLYIRQLSAAENAAPIEFEVSFRLRNLAELQARIAAGETITPAEMAERYYPAESDYAAAAAWFTSQGLTVTETYGHRLSLFVRGSVAQIAQSLQTRFGRVALNGRESSSALVVPSVPQWMAGALVGINGLQPHNLAHKFSTGTTISHITGSVPYFPQDLITAYGAGSTTYDGSGQTIAIVIDALPNLSDVTAFWTGCGVAQSQDRLQFVSLATSLPAASGEETLDAEWASAIAPGATVRVYAAGSLADSALNRAYARIVSDADSIAGLNQVSLSYGADEIAYSSSYLQSESQYFAAMAAIGISVFVSSGDSGNLGYYYASSITTFYPASDPYVTAVGGTSLTLNGSATISAESAWSGSGGGVSTVFSRPSWQTTGTYTKRTVPDLSTVADPNTGALVVLNSTLYQYGGTSWSAPVMAAFCARINQARTAGDLDPMGVFASKLYSLSSSCFRDTTTGSNGYAATTGYDLCTGLGTPVVGALITALTADSSSSSSSTTVAAPTITTQPASVAITSGQTTTLKVVATGTGTLGYQWYKGSAGTATSPVSGATAASFTTPALTATTSYWVAVSNAGGTTASSTATVTVKGPPKITSQPASVTVSVGAKATFSVTASGTPAVSSYQWQRLPAGSSTWANLGNTTTYSGAKTASLVVAKTTATMNGDKFRCIVANGVAPNTTSGTATLTVKVAAPTITKLATTIKRTTSSVSAKITVTVSSSATVTYQWYKGTSGTTTSPISGAKSASYSTGTLTATTSYWVAVTNSGGTANSATVTISK